MRKTELTSQKYDKNMPSFLEAEKMKDEDVLVWLCKLPASMYNGDSIEEIGQEIDRNEARRYLLELTILNDKGKS